MISKEALDSCIQRIRSSSSKALEVVYQSHADWPSASSRRDADPDEPFHVSVFDSSFNPPTLAHQSLALLERPASHGTQPFSAHLLLLSITNADKKLKPTDPTYAQRLQMMLLLAEGMQRQQPGIRVAVAAIDEPTFVGKSRLALEALGGRRCRLCFVVGYDTLVRLFAPQYYGGTVEGMRAALKRFFGDGGDGSAVLCARRDASSSPHYKEESAFLETPEVRPYVQSGKVVMVDIGERAAYSSTAVREGVVKGDEAWRTMCAEDVGQYVVSEGLYRAAV